MLMSEYAFPTPYFRKAGYAFWAVLLAMSVVFFRERVLFLDAGFQVFKMVNESAPQIYHYRFSTLLVQWLPWLAFSLGAPLKWIMILYSASYVLFFGAIYHLIAGRLKNEYLGWALLLLFTLLALDSFYFVQSEFYIGLALLLLAYAWLLRHPELPVRQTFPVCLVLFVFIVFSHKMTAIPFAFLWLFFLLREPRLRHKKYGAVLLLFIALAAFKSAFFTNWYEAAKGAAFTDNLRRFFPDYTQIPALKISLQRFLSDYPIFPLSLFLVTAFYLFAHKTGRIPRPAFARTKCALIWGFSALQICLYALADPDSPYRFYAEINYLPLTLFVAVPLLFDAGKMMGTKTLAGIGALLLFRLFIIAQNHAPYEQRIDWMRRQFTLAHTHHTNRLLMRQQDVPMNRLIQHWAIPYNSLLLSAMEHPDSAKTIFIHEDFDQYKRKDLLEEEGWFLTPFHHQNMPADQMNTRYFRLGNTGKYRLVSPVE
ncbi:MAG: hypothetical protein D6714_18605 [Bacteroidetes bacterium]|nr:MAG: hypothetical protein D6714_18605 [Bacteroidota bacterium]